MSGARPCAPNLDLAHLEVACAAFDLRLVQAQFCNLHLFLHQALTWSLRTLLCFPVDVIA